MEPARCIFTRRQTDRVKGAFPKALEAGFKATDESRTIILVELPQTSYRFWNDGRDCLVS
jgi:hypothetical protein